ncbi:hypothetical protein BU24DRAFT_447808 [Aaosphaeria arxii CBS 175.79]|uniref:Uncharacterized protein n=1 Tax=Aaosphaeria arxii CBS 175.79 TaxID=1450172 RepID=A0A6A5Y1B1_9PLEO|nr:uncharacterized protein BU24DRAFT_447808 [Aaosphaeria arxii CBS 175.79]KAF2019268.1 hypothetical protein BU24DRAFT_447808 [Aaosphaeria arxii CBS 175.79]
MRPHKAPFLASLRKAVSFIAHERAETTTCPKDRFASLGVVSKRTWDRVINSTEHTRTMGVQLVGAPQRLFAPYGVAQWRRSETPPSWKSSPGAARPHPPPYGNTMTGTCNDVRPVELPEWGRMNLEGKDCLLYGRRPVNFMGRFDASTRPDRGEAIEPPPHEVDR